MLDGWRLAVGTLTALPVAPPTAVTGRTALQAVLLAPVAVLPLAVGVLLVGVLGRETGLTPLALGVLAVAVLALGTRVFHWDGLSDTADGLTASYDRERSLDVMKSGTSGPAGVVATVLVTGLQVAGFAALLPTVRGAVLAALLVCLSRLSLTLTCRRGVPAARRDGLGQPLAEVFPYEATILLWIGALGVVTTVGVWADLHPARAVAAVVAPLVVVLALLRRTGRRFGGVTGDVFGAAVELSLAAALVVCAV